MAQERAMLVRLVVVSPAESPELVENRDAVMIMVVHYLTPPSLPTKTVSYLTNHTANAPSHLLFPHPLQGLQYL